MQRTCFFNLEVRNEIFLIKRIHIRRSCYAPNKRGPILPSKLQWNFAQMVEYASMILIFNLYKIADKVRTSLLFCLGRSIEAEPLMGLQHKHIKLINVFPLKSDDKGAKTGT